MCGCGAGHSATRSTPTDRSTTAVATAAPRSASVRRALRAIVTAETQDGVDLIDLPSGSIVERLIMPADPENVAVGKRVAVVVSARSAKVTLLDRYTLRILRIIGGFGSPHIPAIAPDGLHAYVTDDARGTLTAIDLRTLRATSKIRVGAGAHHIAFSPDGRAAWVALGESARTISILDTGDIARPRLVGQFNPGFLAHDLMFSPAGDRVWVTSATGDAVSVFGARDRRLLFQVPVGAPPQHLVFAGRFALLTSGYGDTIEKALASTGAIVARAGTPYGSFELDAGHGVVVSSSLLRGTVAIYNSSLRLLHVVTIAPAARDVAISSP